MRKFWLEPSWTLALFSEAGPFLQKEKNVISNVLILKKYPPFLQLPQGAMPKGSFLQKRKKRTLVNVLIIKFNTLPLSITLRSHAERFIPAKKRK